MPGPSQTMQDTTQFMPLLEMCVEQSNAQSGLPPLVLIRSSYIPLAAHLTQ